MPTGVYVRSELHKARISKSMTGKSPSLETRIKMSKNGGKSLGKKHSQETKNKIGLASKQIHGGRNPFVGTSEYWHIHRWIVRMLGKPNKCENCYNDKLTGQQIHWANISQRYRYNITDWKRLCTSCHAKFDIDIKIDFPYN